MEEGRRKERSEGGEDGSESVGDTALTSGLPTVYLGSEVLGPAQRTEHVAAHQTKQLALGAWRQTDWATVTLWEGGVWEEGGSVCGRKVTYGHKRAIISCLLCGDRV